VAATPLIPLTACWTRWGSLVRASMGWDNPWLRDRCRQGVWSRCRRWWVMAAVTTS